uniref:Plexin n=1 Tax=Schistosoma mansoni TaxID=6183 RepID=A0AA82N8M4_SCHMA
QILKEFDENNLQSWIYYRYKCLDKQNVSVPEPYNRIQIPKKFIKSRILVEFEPNTESCFMKVSNETCLDASKPDMECHWCLTANLCSNGRDTHSKAWMIKNCPKIDNKPMFNYLYVLIPSVIGLVIVCVGFIVWFWLSKRQ